TKGTVVAEVLLLGNGRTRRIPKADRSRQCTVRWSHSSSKRSGDVRRRHSRHRTRVHSTVTNSTQEQHRHCRATKITHTLRPSRGIPREGPFLVSGDTWKRPHTPWAASNGRHIPLAMTTTYAPSANGKKPKSRKETPSGLTPREPGCTSSAADSVCDWSNSATLTRRASSKS